MAGHEKPRFKIEKGRIYFSKETERRIFFVLTLILLCAGIVSKLGWI